MSPTEAEYDEYCLLGRDAASSGTSLTFWRNIMLHLQVRKLASTNRIACFFSLSPFLTMEVLALKRRRISTRLHGVTYHTAVRTSNPIKADTVPKIS